jgi:hypothetical protein
MQTEGTFDYKLDFKFNVVFDSNLRKENLKITKYGEANLTKLGEFVYRAIIKEVPAPGFSRAIKSNYTPIDQISPYLRKCVLTKTLLSSPITDL